MTGTGTILLKGNISGPEPVRCSSPVPGALILQGSNNFGGFLSLQGGTVTLDMPNGGTWSGGSLALGGFSDGTNTFATPTFVVKGPAGGATVNLSGNIAVGGSDSKIIINSTVGAATLNAGNITRGTSGGVVDVALNATGSVTLGSSTLQNGLLPFVTTNSGADFATTSGTLLTPYTLYDVYSAGNLQNNAASNSLINSAGGASIALATGTTNLSTITTKGAGSVTLAMAAGAGTLLNLGTIGAVLSAPGAGTLVIGTTANTSTLNAGGTTANTAGEVLFINNSANSQIVNSAIANNGTAAVAVTKSGSGRTVLNGSGLYTGV